MTHAFCSLGSWLNAAASRLNSQDLASLNSIDCLQRGWNERGQVFNGVARSPKDNDADGSVLQVLLKGKTRSPVMSTVKPAASAAASRSLFFKPAHDCC